MWNYVWPILVVVIANTIYHNCSKLTPMDVNPLASLTVTYIVAAIVSFAAYMLTSPEKNIIHEFQKMNWSSFLLGVAIIGLEFGYLNVYRSGWKVSVGSLVANTSVAIVLVFVGLIFYKETISVKQVIGMALCGGGLVLMNI